ncbi:MAG: hypothetical protein ABSG21_03350 [Spirochaetia bacterium]|jgi:hypothetical protein
MRRSLAAVLCAASLSLGARALGADDLLGFKLSGEMDSEATAAAENAASVFDSLAPFQELSAEGLVDGKLIFSRKYTTLGLFDFTAQDAAVLSHQTGATVETPSLTINELYTDVNFGDLFFLRLGKQRLKWGAGFVYNPSDPVNPPKDPTATRAVREGVPALKAELITPVVSLAGFAVIFDQLRESGVGARLSSSALHGSDLSLSGYWSNSESWTAALNASVSPLYDVPGWDTLQLWFEGGLSGKARYAAFADGSVAGSATTGSYDGVQYSFLFGGSATLPEIRTMVITEYYHLSEGLGASELEAVYSALGSSAPGVAIASQAWLAELARRPARQGRDYLFLSLTQPSITDSGDPVWDKIGLRGSGLVNLTDLSYFVQAAIITTFITDSSVELGLIWAQGGRLTEFGNSPSGISGSLTVRVYF